MLLRPGPVKVSPKLEAKNNEGSHRVEERGRAVLILDPV